MNTAHTPAGGKPGKAAGAGPADPDGHAASASVPGEAGAWPSLANLQALGQAMSQAIEARADAAVGAAFSDDEVERFYAVAYQLVTQGDLVRAQTVLLQVCDLRPGEPRYLRALAVVRRDLGDPDAAASLFQVIDMLEPGNPRNALDLAECWLRSGSAVLGAKARTLLAMTVAHCESLGLKGPVPERALALVRLLDRQGDANEQTGRTPSAATAPSGPPGRPR